MKELYVFLAFLGAFVVIRILVRIAASSNDTPQSLKKPTKKTELVIHEKKALVFFQGDASYFSPKTDDEVVKWLIERIIVGLTNTPHFRVSQMETWKKEHVVTTDKHVGDVQSLVVGFNCSYEVFGKPYSVSRPNGDYECGTHVEYREGFTAVYEVCRFGNTVVIYRHGRASIVEYKSISWGHDKKYWNDPGGPLTESLFNDFEIKDGIVEVRFGRHLIRNYPDYTSKRQDTRYVVRASSPIGYIREEEVAIRH